MQWGVLGPSQPVEVAQGLFELPAAIEHGPFAPQRVEHVELHVAEVAGILEQRPAGVLDPPGLGRRGWGALSRPTPFPLRLWVSPSFLVPRSPSRLVESTYPDAASPGHLRLRARRTTHGNPRSPNIVHVDKKRRLPNVPMRRALEARDRCCSFPGCHRTARLQTHHTKWYSRNGDTVLGNLGLYCWAHHRLVHEGKVTIEK